jgi:4-diphosphocytidyl-2-C-methyl-D-erythritol kinase
MTAAGREVAVAAPAKLNLYLHVVGRRDDGFHLLDSLICFAGVHDTVLAAPGDGLELQVIGPNATALSGEPDNLVLRAARLLAEDSGIDAGARITLIKRLPVAAGIGGGSADAAAALRALSELWKTGPGDGRMMEIAGRLGADVPVCLYGASAYVGGVGEVIEPAPPLPATPLLLVNPGLPLSTPEVFRAREGAFGQAGRFMDRPVDVGQLAALLAARRNDLTDAAVSLQPIVRDCLTAIANRPGALLARMSGSGATCFGLFEDATACAAAAAHLQAVNPSWWVAATQLVEAGGAITPDRQTDG